MTAAMSMHPIARDVTLLVAIKLMVIFAAGWLVFGENERPKVDAHIIASKLFDIVQANQPTRIKAP